MFEVVVYELGRKQKSWTVPALGKFMIVLEKAGTKREDNP